MNPFRTYGRLFSQLSAGTYPTEAPAELTAAVSAVKAARAAQMHVAGFGETVPDSSVPGFMFMRRVANGGPAGYAEELLAALLAGQPLPGDWSTRAALRRMQDAEAQAAAEVATELESKAEAHFDTVAAQSVDELLSDLRYALDAWTADGRQTAQALAGYDVERPEQLLDAPSTAVAAFRHLDVLDSEQRALRAAARAVLTPEIDAEDRVGTWGPLRRAGWDLVRDVPGLHSDWRQAEVDPSHPGPWPDNPRALVLLVVQHQPWLPTLSDVNAARACALGVAA